jgi:hypothetical protein
VKQNTPLLIPEGEQMLELPLHNDECSGMRECKRFV